MTPKVSIIVPVYNTEIYLRPCLDSIVSQTFTDFEAVLVDDGSTDGSGSICDEYAENDDRFVVVHKQNEGVAKARLTAFEKSKGEYIMFLDSDDFIDKTYIEIMINTIQAYHVDMVSCQFCFYQCGKLHPIKRSVFGYLDKEEINKMLRTNYLYDKITKSSGIPIILCTKMVHKRFVKEALKVGENLKWGEDQTSLFHILLHIKSLYVLDDCLYYYVLHHGQATSVYKPDLIPNLFNAYSMYQQLDAEKLLSRQLHIRTWLFSIKKTIFSKMPLAIRDHSSFVGEMKRIEKMPAWHNFFSQNSTYLDWKNNLQFWILKLRMYSLFYYAFYHKTLKKQ